ncbi:MAG: hypothetical protein L0Y56_01675 [Nitrospira sp.]|nr:hypothetical protein [Nitrospira sp.]
MKRDNMSLKKQRQYLSRDELKFAQYPVKREMKQGDVWKKVKDAFTEQWPKGHIERVENLLGRGMPDVTWCAGLAPEGWIEIKTGYKKPTPIQRDWISRRRAAGGRAAVLTVRSHQALVELKEEGEVIVVEPIDWAYIIRLITNVLR